MAGYSISGAEQRSIEMGKAAVGVVVDSVTEVSTIDGKDIERHVQATKKLEKYVCGVGKQGDKLIVILDLAKIISDSEDELPESEMASTQKSIKVEQIPAA